MNNSYILTKHIRLLLLYHLLVHSGLRSRAPHGGTENCAELKRIRFTDDSFDDVGRISCRRERTEEKTESMPSLRLRIASNWREWIYVSSHKIESVKNEMCSKGVCIIKMCVLKTIHVYTSSIHQCNMFKTRRGNRFTSWTTHILLMCEQTSHTAITYMEPVCTCSKWS